MGKTPPTGLTLDAQNCQQAYNDLVAIPRVVPGNFLLNLAGYATIAIVGFVGWFAVESPNQRWTSLALMLAFALLNLYFDSDHGRRHMHFYLPMQTLVVAALLLVAYEQALLFNVLFFILSAQAMLCLPVRQAAPWILVFCLISGASAVLTLGWIGLLSIMPNFGGYAFFATFGNLLRVAQEQKARSQQLVEELRAAQSRLQELAIAEERNRLAREMHDSLGHRLTVTVVQLEGAQRLIPTDPERAARMIGAMREQMKEALTDLRGTVATLRTPLADDLPLDTALARLASSFQEGTGLAVHLDLQPGLPGLPESHRLAIYRAAQESLTNAQRHAGARKVRLKVAADNGRITLTAADDGIGFPQDLNGEGFGLLGLRERAAQLGGQVHLEPGPGGGAQVRFELPLEGRRTGDG